jgi:hypothetical protein
MFGAVCGTSDTRCKKVRDTITQSSRLLEEFTEVFSPCAEENTLGYRLMDKYPDRVTFMTFDPKEEDVLPRRCHLCICPGEGGSHQGVLWDRLFHS